MGKQKRNGKPYIQWLVLASVILYALLGSIHVSPNDSDFKYEAKKVAKQLNFKTAWVVKNKLGVFDGIHNALASFGFAAKIAFNVNFYFVKDMFHSMKGIFDSLIALIGILIGTLVCWFLVLPIAWFATFLFLITEKGTGAYYLMYIPFGLIYGFIAFSLLKTREPFAIIILIFKR